jgi:1-deoxy-D-xylulose-5-phosphate reductoisomerase
MKKKLTILGSTGSIGQNALSVIALHPELFQVEGLSARSDAATLFQQCQKFEPNFAVLSEESAAQELQTRLKSIGSKTQVFHGEKALCELSADSGSDTILAAIVGAAGLKPTLSAVKAGKRILLANKEPLVMAGHLFMQAVREHNATLLAVDSEHNAVMQVLPENFRAGEKPESIINSIILTASGGPFRDYSLEQMRSVTPEQAVQHPNWVMGKKISVDSATMMNKGLEIIEAHHLFSLPIEKISVVIHPQSIVHAVVRYCDGSSLAQMSYPDMRVPIANALAFPDRIISGVPDLDFMELHHLEFKAVELERYPCLHLAYQAIEAGDSAMCALNAANEIAVAEFLSGKIGFLDIPNIIDSVLSKIHSQPLSSLEQVLELDQQARELALAPCCAE